MGIRSFDNFKTSAAQPKMVRQLSLAGFFRRRERLLGGAVWVAAAGDHRVAQGADAGDGT